MKQAVSVLHSGLLHLLTDIRFVQLPRCEKWVQHACIETMDAMNCEAAMNFCSTELMVPFFNTGKCFRLDFATGLVVLFGPHNAFADKISNRNEPL